MASLPESLYGTYKQYKVDTDKFVTWLAETAQLCGYRLPRSQLPSEPELPPAKAPKLKGRARKLARDAAQETAKNKAKIGTETFIVGVGDFLPMAEAIANFKQKPPVEVPLDLVTVAKRVLLARKRCTKWFQQQSQDKTTDLKNQSHLHFISVLDQVVEILTPRFANAPTLPKRSKVPLATVDTDASTYVKTDVLNRFDTLSIEEPVTDEEVDIPLPSDSSLMVEKSRNIVFESEKTADDEELLFACFCLLGDLNEIRSYLRDVWKKFLHRKIALVTASLVTDAAFDIARRMEQDFWQQFPTQSSYFETVSYPVPSKDVSVIAGGGSVFVKVCFLPFTCREHKEALFSHHYALRISPPELLLLSLIRANKDHQFVKFFYGTACKARGQPAPVAQGYRQVQCGYLLNSSMSDILDWTFLHSWTIVEQNCRQSRFAYSPELKERLDVVAALGPSALEAMMASAPKPGSTESYLVHFASMLVFFSKLPHLYKEHGTHLTKDNFVRGLFSCTVDDQEVPVWLAFAAQVHFDLQYILQDVGLNEVFAQTLTEYQKTEDSYKSYLKFLTSPQYAHLQSDNTTKIAQHVRGLIERTTEESEAMKSELVRDMLGRHPSLCGLVIFDLHMHSQVVGKTEADLWGSIVTAAHVYNAAQQEGILTSDWPDLELVIDIHTAQHLFIGDRPSSRDKYYLRWRIAMGFSIFGGNLLSRRGQRQLSLDRTPFCELLDKLSRSTDSARDDQAEDLELIVAMVTGDATARKKIKLLEGGTLNRAELRKSCAGLPKASPLQLLQQLEKHVTAEMAELHFDYLGLTIRCCALEEKFRTTCQKLLPHEDVADPDFPGLTPQTALMLLQEPIGKCTCRYKFCPDKAFRFVPFHTLADIYAGHITQNGSIGIDALQEAMPSYRRASSVEDGRPGKPDPQKGPVRDSQALSPGSTIPSFTDEEKEAMKHLVRKKVAKRG